MRALVGCGAIVIAAFMVFRVSSAPGPPANQVEVVPPETTVATVSTRLDPVAPNGESFIQPESRALGDLDYDLLLPASERQARRDGETFIGNFTGRSCNFGQGTDALFEPVQIRAEASSGPGPIDVPPLVEVVTVGQMALPTGELVVSAGEDLGADADAIAVGAPGVYPYYHLTSRSGQTELVLFAQLVLAENTSVMRWGDAPDLAIPASESYSTWIGSPTSSAGWLVEEGAVSEEIASRYSWDLLDQMLTGSGCRWFDVGEQRATGVLVLTNDQSTPAAAGYGADGQLVAITWLIHAGDWSSAGLPGDLSALDQ